MRFLVILALVMQSYFVFSDWILGTITIDKNCDLKLDFAWHIGNKGKQQQLSVLTDMLQKPSSLYGQYRVKYTINSSGIALHGKDGVGHEVDIFLDGQSSYSIKSGRKKTTSITHFAQQCLIEDWKWCARVVMKDRADGKILAEPVAYGYDDDAQKFNMTISGSKGSYVVELVEQN